MGKQLVNFITCGCESNNLQSHAVLVIGLYELLGMRLDIQVLIWDSHKLWRG